MNLKVNRCDDTEASPDCKGEVVGVMPASCV